MTKANTNLPDAEMIVEGVNFGAGARMLASGMTGLAPAPFNVLGASLIAALWPSTSQATTDWQNVYTELQTIVQNQLEAETVQIAKDKLNGYLLFINNTYLPAKQNVSKLPNKDLFDLLESQDYNKTFYDDIVSVFIHDTSTEKSAAALANFMLGAQLQLNLNQELALTDPSVSDPNKSIYAGTIVKLCTETYRNYALNAANNVLAVRVGQIGNCVFHEKTHYGAPPNQWYVFADLNGDHVSPNFNTEASCVSYRSEYTTGIEDALKKTLQSQVYDILDHWQTIGQNPVPTKS